MRLAAIYRHPVKGLGEEALARVALAPGAHLPWDRVWALAHAGSAWDPAAPAWVARKNFVQTAQSPELAATGAAFDGTVLTLTAPGRAPLTAAPEDAGGAAAIAAWAEAVAGHRQGGPYRLARAPVPLTDVAEAHVSILSDASLRALSSHAGQALERRRFRGNLWIDGDGLAPWEEAGWVGREIAVGSVRLRVTEPIGRCNAIAASPATGSRDVALLDILRAVTGETDFGLYAQVVAGGVIAPGDPVSDAAGDAAGDPVAP